MFAVPYTSGSTTEQFQALGQLLRSIYTDKWVHYNQVKLDSRKRSKSTSPWNSYQVLTQALFA